MIGMTRRLLMFVIMTAALACIGHDGAAAAEPALPTQPARVDALGDPLPEAARLRLGTQRFRHPSSVVELALSPDEKTIVSVGGRQIIAWDTDTGRERWRASPGAHGMDLPGAAYGIHALAFARDGETFYTPGGADEALLWETASGRRAAPPEQQLAGPPRSGSKSVDLSADGRLVALGGASGLIVFTAESEFLYEIANAHAEEQPDFDQGDRLGFFGAHTMGQFSPDGKLLAVVASDFPEAVRLCDAQSGREIRRIAVGSRLVRLAFSPDGAHLAATERDSSVRLYDIATGARVWEHVVKLDNPFENYTSAIAYSPDGQLIAVCATDYDIHLLDALTGEEVGRLNGHRWNPWALAFTSDGRRLYSSGWDGAIRRWDVAARKQLALPQSVHASGAAAATPDGRTLAFVDDSGAVRMVSATDGAEERVLSLPGTQYSQLVFSADSTRVAGGGTSEDDVHVAVWNAADGELLHRWDWPKGRDPHSRVEALAFTPDGSRLAACVFRQSSAYLWDLDDGRQIAVLNHTNVYGLSFSPDESTLATAGWDKVVRFWNAETGELRRDFPILEDGGNGDVRMYAVSYAPQGNLLATAHLDGTVRIWKSAEMTQVSRFSVPGRFVYGAIAFSNDGKHLATGSQGGQVVVWDSTSGESVWNTGRHDGYVYTVSFGKDSRTLLTGGRDGVCYVWDVQLGGAQP